MFIHYKPSNTRLSLFLYDPLPLQLSLVDSRYRSAGQQILAKRSLSAKSRAYFPSHSCICIASSRLESLATSTRTWQTWLMTSTIVSSPSVIRDGPPKTAIWQSSQRRYRIDCFDWAHRVQKLVAIFSSACTLFRRRTLSRQEFSSSILVSTSHMYKDAYA